MIQPNLIHSPELIPAAADQRRHIDGFNVPSTGEKQCVSIGVNTLWTRSSTPDTVHVLQ